MYFLFSSISEVHDLLVSLYFPATNNQLAMEWFLLMAAFMGFRWGFSRLNLLYILLKRDSFYILIYIKLNEREMVSSC